MRKLLLGTAAAVGLVGPAVAADMAVLATKAPPVAPLFGWTGCYVGGHTGYLWGSDEWTNRTPGGAFDNQWLGGHRVTSRGRPTAASAIIMPLDGITARLASRASRWRSSSTSSTPTHSEGIR
jgi:opacity protein-like surface antigen